MAYRLPILRPVKEIEDRIPPDSFGVNPTQFDEMPGTEETPWSGDVGFGALPEPPRTAPQQDFGSMAPGYTGPAYTPGPGIGATGVFNDTASYASPFFLSEPEQVIPPPAPAPYSDYEWSEYDMGIPASYEPKPMEYEGGPSVSEIAPGISASRTLGLRTDEGAERIRQEAPEFAAMVAASGKALLDALKPDVFMPSVKEGGDWEGSREQRQYERSQAGLGTAGIVEGALSYPGLAPLGIAGTTKGTLRLTGKALEQTLDRAAQTGGRLAAEEVGAMRFKGGPSGSEMAPGWDFTPQLGPGPVTPRDIEILQRLEGLPEARSSAEPIPWKSGINLSWRKIKPSKLPDLVTADDIRRRQARKPVWEGLTEPGVAGEVVEQTRGEGLLRLPSGRVPGGPRPPSAGGPTPPGDELGKLDAALTPDDRGAWQKVVDAKDRLVRATLDKNAPLAKLDVRAGSETGPLAQVVPGSRAYGENIIRTEFEPVIAPLGKDIKNLEKYMVLKRSEDLLARNPSAELPMGINSWGQLINMQKAFEARIGPDRLARIQQAAESLWGKPGKVQDGIIYKYILKPLEDEGIVSAQQVRDMTATHPHYVSFRRVMGEDGMEILPGMNQPANVSSTGIKKMRIEGSGRKLDNPLASTLAQVISVQERVARNKAGRALFEALEGMGEARIKATPGPAPLGEGTMSFFKDGQKIVAEVPEVYAAVAKGLEAEAPNLLSRIAMKGAAPLRAGATTYNPAFVIINPIRDFITASYQTGLRTMVSPEYIQGWIAAFTKNAAFQDAAKDGALMGGIIDSFADTKQLAKISGRRLLGIQMNSVGDAALYLPRLIKEVNTASERATRVGVYLKSKNEGMAGLQSAVRARNSTVDFAKSGTVIKLINQAIPFLNAGIQGASNTLKVMKESPSKAVVRAAPLAAVSAMAYLNNRRFESSSLIPEYEYRNNWIFIVAEERSEPDPKTGEVTTYPVYIKIPKGPSGAVLTLPAEFAIRFAQQKGDYSLQKDMVETILSMGETLSPVSISPSSVILPGLGTVVETAANRDLYTGREIVPFKEQRKPAEQQFGPETSRQAVAISQMLADKKIGISPRIIDFAGRDYFAGTGQAANWLLDLALGSMGYDPQVPGEATLQQRTETEKLARTPVASRFMGVKGTEQERKEYEALRLAIEETQRRFAKEYPSSVRLGLTIGEVSDSVTQDGKTLYFTPKEQAEIQKKAYEVAKPLLDAVVNEKGFKKKYSIEDQRKRIQKVMAEARKRARNQALIDMGKAERTKRLKQSMGAPLKLAAGGR